MSATRDRPRSAGGLIRRAGALRWQLAAPAVLTAALGLRAGGFFPDTVAVLAIALLLLAAGLVTLRAHPLSGWTPALAVSVGALGLLAAWTLVSATWSDAPFRAMTEFDRTLAYALVLGFAGFFATRPGDLDRVLALLALVIIALAVAALATRLFPGTFPTEPGKDPARLAFPLTYWNALGILCAVGCVLALHVSAAGFHRPLVRVLAAGALPVVAVTLYFTFSRGAIAVAGLGVVAYALLAHPRRLPVAFLAAGIPTALALVVAYDAEGLATSDYARFDDEAHRVAAVVAAAAVAAMVLRAIGLAADRRIDALSLTQRTRRAVLATAVAALLAALVVGAAATDLVGRIGDEVDASGPSPSTVDRRARLGNFRSAARLDHWEVALLAFERRPSTGTGAGTFELEWERERDVSLNATDGHSLYLEVLAELGWPGLLLLATALSIPLAVATRRLRGAERHAHGAFLAAGVALLVHAGIDWDWEMPAVFAWFVGVSGLVCAARTGARTMAEPGRVGRVVAGLACLVLAVTPASVVLSQYALERAARAFEAGDCRAATDAALDSLDALSVRPEPFELLGYCDIRAGQRSLGLRAMRAALARDPRNWRYVYGVAVAQALDGQNPNAAAATAARLNPFDERARSLRRELSRGGRGRWAETAAKARLPFD